MVKVASGRIERVIGNHEEEVVANNTKLYANIEPKVSLEAV
ncbi:MAG: hypothetical protein U0T32_01225 [Chitinophagales bacterium]